MSRAPLYMLPDGIWVDAESVMFVRPDNDCGQSPFVLVGVGGHSQSFLLTLARDTDAVSVAGKIAREINELRAKASKA